MKKRSELVRKLYLEKMSLHDIAKIIDRSINTVKRDLEKFDDDDIKKERLIRGHMVNHLSIETRNKMSVIRKGKHLSEEHKENIRKSLSGVPLAEERKAKISKSLMGRSFPKNLNNNGIHGLKGRPRTEEHKKKISESHKKLWKNLDKSEYYERTIKGLRGANKGRKATDIEIIVAEWLETLAIEFEREKEIDTYFIDFYLSGKKIAIECDGDHWHDMPENKERDKIKDKYLNEMGIKVLRITRSEIKRNPDSAYEKIIDIIWG